MARRSILEERPEIAGEICTLLEQGNYLEVAAQACGVTPQSVYNWMRRGSEGEEPFKAFFDAVTRARAQGEVDLLATVKEGDDAGKSFGPAKAAAHILAVTRPQRYATRVNVKVRDQLREFLEFLEGELDQQTFLRVCERWMNRQPVETSESGSGQDGSDADAGRQTLQ